MFSKILIANRGEIAVRIMQTCRQMGIRTVAVFSAADGGALHVRTADEAFCIGPAPPLESYLRGEAILDAARRSNAEAIHPGYGFLAENPDFAREVTRAGLAWIGPSAEAMELMGDKAASKRLAESLGVPTVPGYSGEDQSPGRLSEEADRIGYPLMVKAVAGGGGRGMRAVQRREDLQEALEAAGREARSSFGDARLLLERLLVDPRHIEIQVLADAQGNVLHLGERECSVQRRHQKVVEESPSPVLTDRLRALMGADAVQLARACGYVNAGTVEFLFKDDRHYFLEMNTRIQVEHPVTEMVMGLDLVRLQIQIAAGEELPLSRLDSNPRGHAVEARLYAEDPEQGFAPAAGKLALFCPPHGAGIRNDVGVAQGGEVSGYYDAMLAKLIACAETRSEAIERLRTALEDYEVLGVTTNLPFLHWVTSQPDFRAGRVDTGYVERSWRAETHEDLPSQVLLAAAASELLETSPKAHASNPWTHGGSWRHSGFPRTVVYRYRDREYSMQVAAFAGGNRRIVLDDVPHDVAVQAGAAGALIVREGPEVIQCAVRRTPEAVSVQWRGDVYDLARVRRLAAVGNASESRHASAGLSAPMPSTVVRVAVQKGEKVSARQTLVVLEAMKMEHVIQAPHDGVVADVHYAEGDLVPAGSAVVSMEEP